MGGVSYENISDQGLTIQYRGQSELLDADKIVVCAGQESVRPFEDKWSNLAGKIHVIGGADKAGELDAVRAIRQGLELAIKL